MSRGRWVLSILGLSSTHAGLSFIKTAAQAAQKQATAAAPKVSSGNSLIDVLGASDPAKAQAWRDEQAQNSQLLKQLAASKTTASAERKEAARQKIQQLKAQIQALRMMAQGDPKTVARQAARLARELASAVREYAGSGDGSDMSAPATTGATTNVAPTDDADVKEAVAEDAAPESLMNLAGTGEARLSFNQDDGAFAGEARGLMNNLKNILKQARDKMARQDGGYHTRDTQEAESALQETQRGLNMIMAGALSISVWVDTKA